MQRYKAYTNNQNNNNNKYISMHTILPEDSFNCIIAWYQDFFFWVYIIHFLPHGPGFDDVTVLKS